MPQSALLGAKIGAMARKVSGTIETSPRNVANSAPSRIPNHAGMKMRQIPPIAIATVHHAMNVWIGVIPDVRSSPNSEAM